MYVVLGETQHSIEVDKIPFYSILTTKRFNTL
jgi:hypothetical protein